MFFFSFFLFCLIYYYTLTPCFNRCCYVCMYVLYCIVLYVIHIDITVTYIASYDVFYSCATGQQRRLTGPFFCLYPFPNRHFNSFSLSFFLFSSYHMSSLIITEKEECYFFISTFHFFLSYRPLNV